MRFAWVFIASVCFLAGQGYCKRKFDGDFEFAEEDDTRIMKVGDKKRWIHDPDSELCRTLNCKKKELCLLEDTFTAVCVSKKELHKSGDIVIPKSRAAVQQRRSGSESGAVDSADSDSDDDPFFDSEDDEDDDDENQDESRCQNCPIVKPEFLCATDNRTYSSPCRLDYHNCIHHTSVHIACNGFCPCRSSDIRLHPKKLQFRMQGKNRRIGDITLTPRDFNYDNHHYQYLKYSKRMKALGSKYDDEKRFLTNEVLDKNSELSSSDPDCPPSSKPAMANRLLDWFSVVMADAKRRRQRLKLKGRFPGSCQAEVRWMFRHLDMDGDGRISLSEFYSLEHDQNEPCLKPFLDACDINGDIFVNRMEWCGCFVKAERPCLAMRRRTSSDVAPSCDPQGYYRSTQCHRGLGLCWCVDPHGVEFAGTRTRGTKPDCDAIVNKIGTGGLKGNNASPGNDVEGNDSVANDDDADDDDDEDNGIESSQDLEGSADQPLDF